MAGSRKRKLLDEDWVPCGPFAGPSSSSPAPAQGSPSTKKQRKSKQDPSLPEEEKRLARFKPACPQNIRDRVDRVMTQRFFMIARTRADGALHEEFKVLGSTGNVYTVTVDKLPSCDCPDATKGNHCKHILFIFLKVLSVPQHSHVWYQKALLSTELEAIFAAAPRAPNHVSNPRVQAAYARAAGTASASSSSSAAVDADAPARRMPEEGTDCAICYDEMHGAPEAQLEFCATCGNACHAVCFKQWARNARPLTCVYCRSPWVEKNAPAADAAVGKGGYVNLSGAAGISPVRDTSSYYHGPRRGRRLYEAYDYDD